MTDRSEIRVLLIPSCHTAWDLEHRLGGSVDLPLSERGLAVAHKLAAQLAGEAPSIILSSPDEASTATAKCIAPKADIRALPDLAEMSLGLWEGQTREMLENRCPSACRRWETTPSEATAPDGETLLHVFERLGLALNKALARVPAGTTVGVVLRPIAFSAARCWLRQLSIDRVWNCQADRPSTKGYVDGELHTELFTFDKPATERLVTPGVAASIALLGLGLMGMGPRG